MKSTRYMRLAVLTALLVLLAYAQTGTKSFAKVVTTAGTRVALSSTSLRVRSFVVMANTGNTGTIYAGGSDVSSTNGVPLAKGQSEGWLPLGKDVTDTYDLSLFYIDASVNGEGVKVQYAR